MEPLYGRADVIDRAVAAVERAFAGEGRLVLFTGEPGIGKSALAERVAAEASARHAAVAWGRCWEAGGAPAYWPWIQVFRGLGMEEDPFAGAMAGVAVGAAEARFAAFDRAVRALKAQAERAPLALFLDDLHAADAPSLLLLLLLARELRGARILVVGACRDAEARFAPELAPLLAKLAREAEVVPLRRLSAEDVAAWGHAAGTSETGELYRLTEGHPLFVVEALRLGDAHVQVGLGGVLDEHLGRLGATTRALLEAAAVLGRDFSAADVAAIAGADRDAVHAALSEAVATSIVAPTGEPERFRFSHVLLRDRIHADLAPSTRATLHFRAATATLARGEPALAVHHLFEGESAASPERVAEVALAAAEASLSRLAFEEAERVARRALGLGALPEPLGARLRVVLAESLIRLGESAEAKALCVQAADAGERAGAADVVTRAALVYATELLSGIVDPQMIALLRRALAQLDEEDSPARARLLARLAAALTPPENPAVSSEILAATRTATAMARRLGDWHTLLYVLQFAATVALLVHDDERFSFMEETVQLAGALEQRLVLLTALPAYIVGLLARGERAKAEAMLPRYQELLADSRQPLHRVHRAIIQALFCALRGEYEEADRLSNEARVTAERAASGAGLRIWITQRVSFALLRGEPELLRRDAAAIVAQLQQMPATIPYAAWALLAIGRREEAAAWLRTVDLSARSIPTENLLNLLCAADLCAQLGDAALGEVIYPRLVRAAEQPFVNFGPGALIGPTTRTLGDLARLIGRPQDALRHYDEAIAFCERLGAPALVELCRRARAAIEHVPAPAATPRTDVTLRREGDVWALTSAGRTIRLKQAKGLGYLNYLMEHAGRQVHVLELVGVDHPAGDAGPVLDARAKQDYRQRLDDLRDQLAEAERFDDVARSARIEAEIAAVADQLAGAVGLGGRDRRAASAVERLRINVQRCLKDVIDRVAALDPALGRYLSAAVKSGTYCVYLPL